MSGNSKSSQTPVMRQYYEIKSKNPDAIILFRMGDFYETFDKDALITSDILGIVLNGPPHNDNPKTLEQFGDTKILASLPIFEEVSAEKLSQEWNKQQLDKKLEQYI